MKTRVFACMALLSSLVTVACAGVMYFQARTLESVSLDPLVDSLSEEDTKVLLWVLGNVPQDRIETMELPQSWAEIFVLDATDLVLVASTNPSHRGLPLYRHPLLLDQAQTVVDAMKTGRVTRAQTSQYSLAVVPSDNSRVLIALKPKAWERALVKSQADRIESATRGFHYVVLAFLCLGIAVSLAAAYLAAVWVTSPASAMVRSLEALSLGSFDALPDRGLPGSDGEIFEESFIRLKTSLEMAMDMLSRR
ncbi:MAG TPA: hypothetical protein PLW83_06730 [Deltaproteobacteria bacterium]|nr:hypothetical protein [Deltaproteobacteria bacterium]